MTPFAGLGAVGVALVAVAAKGLVGKAIKGPLTSTILLMSACISYVFSAAWLFPALIVGGGLVTLLFNTFVTHASMALAVRSMPLSCSVGFTIEFSLGGRDVFFGGGGDWTVWCG